MRLLSLKQQPRNSFVCGKQQQSFGILIQPANSMGTLREVKVDIAQQTNFVCTHKLRDHVIGFVQQEIPVWD
jgi:hypothetical protein